MQSADAFSKAKPVFSAVGMVRRPRSGATRGIRGSLLGLALLTAPAAVNAAALEPLAENPRVQSEFLAAAVGDEIRKNCPTISARLFRAVHMARELERYALGLGYTEEDIRAMRKDPAAKALLKRRRDAYLSANGVVEGDPDSYCRLGREEIATKTLTGRLLRARR